MSIRRCNLTIFIREGVRFQDFWNSVICILLQFTWQEFWRWSRDFTFWGSSYLTLMMRVGSFRDLYTSYQRLTACKVREGYRGSCHVSAVWHWRHCLCSKFEDWTSKHNFELLSWSCITFSRKSLRGYFWRNEIIFVLLRDSHFTVVLSNKYA